jgi:hypothetical protein
MAGAWRVGLDAGSEAWTIQWGERWRHARVLPGQGEALAEEAEPVTTAPIHPKGSRCPASRPAEHSIPRVAAAPPWNDSGAPTA